MYSKNLYKLYINFLLQKFVVGFGLVFKKVKQLFHCVVQGEIA
jgi:hypothetical protein